MRLRQVVLLVGVCVLAGSCSRAWTSFPWGKKDVPVTPPAQEPAAAEEPAEAPQQAKARAAAGDRRPGPAAPPTAPVGAKVTGEPEIVAASLLQANNHFFTIDDIVEAARGELVRLPKGLEPWTLRRRVEEIISTAVRQEISRKLAIEQINKRITDEQNDRIKAQVADKLSEMIAEAGGSRKVLDRKFEAEGTTLDRAMEEYRDALKVEFHLREKFAPAADVSRRALLEYYRSHQKEFVSPKKAQMQIIAAPISAFVAEDVAAPTASELESAKLKARKTIDKAAQALKEGKDFGDVAKTFSKGFKAESGGLWPPMPAGSFLHKEVEKAAFAMKEGQVSGIIETPAGFFVVKTKRAVAEKVVSFEEAQAGIEQRLRAAEHSKLTEKYLYDLYSSATVTRNEEFFDLAVDRAIAKYVSH